MLPVWAEKLSQNRGSPNKLWQSPLGHDQRPKLKRKKGVNPGVTETTGDPEAILGNIPGDIPSSSHSCQQASTSMGLPVHEPLSSIPGHQPLSIRYIKDLVPSEFPCWLIIMSDKKLKKISTFRCLNLIKQFSKIYGRHVNYQYCFLLSLTEAKGHYTQANVPSSNKFVPFLIKKVFLPRRKNWQMCWHMKSVKW